MNNKLKISEQYKKGDDVINFVVYDSTTGVGEDEVLQHKMVGLIETAHVTLHPDGTVNFRKTRLEYHLKNAISDNLQGYKPNPSNRLMQFLIKISSKI